MPNDESPFIRDFIVNHPLVVAVPARNGRVAILARHDQTSPWTQIESIASPEFAEEFANEMIENPEKRDGRVEESLNDSWGTHEPYDWKKLP
jgi:hypothetical protein